jgi:y4mF family transcriptional regulator
MARDIIADFVRRRRKALGLTQVELAERAGVGLRFVRELEQGKPTVRRDKVEQVLALFGHTLGAVPMDRRALLEDPDAE